MNIPIYVFNVCPSHMQMLRLSQTDNIKPQNISKKSLVENIFLKVLSSEMDPVEIRLIR